MPKVSTIQILARRTRELACGSECIDWAIGLLESGHDSPSLRILSGLTPPLNHFELSSLRDRVLEELRLPETDIQNPVSAYVSELVATALTEGASLVPVFAQLTQLAISLEYPRELMPFYNLHFAWEDLQHSDVQWYWDGATRNNIDRIMREQAEEFVARSGG